MNRPNTIAAAVVVIEAVDKAGSVGLDRDQLEKVLSTEGPDVGGVLGTQASRRRAYRWMDALEASGYFEQVGDLGPNPHYLKRIRRVKAGRAAA